MKELKKSEIAELITSYHPVILDIGCYDGKDSLELAQELDRDCTIHCFDPDHRSNYVFELVSGGDFRLKLHKIALGNYNGSTKLYLSDSTTRRHYKFFDSWSASSSLKKPKAHLDLFPDVSFDEIAEVEVIKLDEWYSNNIRPSTIIDFVWCDTNGAEDQVILGGNKTFLKYVKYLFIEFCSKELYQDATTKKQILQLLPTYEEMGVYNYAGNFGNLLLRNTRYEF